MAENITVAVIIIAEVITACIAWYMQGKIDGLKESRRIVEKHFNGKEQE